jgi:hypothetical protein
MAIRLQIEVTSPLTTEDHELLSGVSVLLLSVANHTLAAERFPEAFGDDEPGEPVAPAPCGMPDGEGRFCVGKVAHVGRHRFRAVTTPDIDPALVN